MGNRPGFYNDQTKGHHHNPDKVLANYIHVNMCIALLCVIITHQAMLVSACGSVPSCLAPDGAAYLMTVCNGDIER